MNLTGQPIYQKPEKAPKAPDYLDAVRALPCCICEAFGEIQNSPTEAHHWIMGRGGNLKTPDKEALPLCNGHHTGDFDKTKIAIHRNPKAWREAYGADHEYIQVTQDKIEATANTALRREPKKMGAAPQHDPQKGSNHV